MSSSTNANTGRNEPFTTEQNDEVYRRLVSGDKKARDEMIEGNMALVVHRADEYLRKAPQMAYYRDDMMSAGFVGLCEAVDRMRKVGLVKNPRPTGCISHAIDRAINHLVDRANTIVVPDRVQRRARAEGEPIRPPRIVSEKALFDVHDSAYQNQDALKEVYEEALACCNNKREKRIVSMRAAGHTDAEIAPIVNLSRRRVSVLREAIFKRFYERCPEYLLRKDRCKEGKDD
jgi:RNA polymerase sigma factor (sigma-70 family)